MNLTRNRAPADEYALIVGRVFDFLSGRVNWVARKLKLEMESAAANCEYERAAELRERLQFCKNFSSRQLFTRKFKSGPMIIREQGDLPLTYRFMKGNLIEIHPEGGDRGGSGSIPEELSRTETDARLVLDRAILVYGWLNRNAGNCRFAFGKATPRSPSTGSQPRPPTHARAPERSSGN